MNILITGGSGFVGTYLVKRLLKENHDVRIIDILYPSLDVISDVEYFKVNNIETKEVYQDKIFRDIDIVFHLASKLPIHRLSLQKYRLVNVTGLENILKMSYIHNIPKIINISTSAVYGIPKCPVTEQSIRKPVENYGISKYESELKCVAYRNLFGMNISNIRPRAIIGEERLGAFYLLFLSLKNNKPLYCIGNGNNKVQLVSVEDLIDLLMLLTKKKYKNEDFNVGTDKFGTLNEDMNELIIKGKSKSIMVHIPSSLGKNACKIINKVLPIAEWHYELVDKDFYFDITKANKLLGWYPKNSNTDMLLRSYNWYLNNPLKGKNLSKHKSPIESKILRLFIGN